MNSKRASAKSDQKSLSELRNERSTLIRHLTQLRQEADEHAVEYQVLQEEVEALRAKISIAEEAIEAYYFPHDMPVIPDIAMEHSSRRPSNSELAVAVVSNAATQRQGCRRNKRQASITTFEIPEVWSHGGMAQRSPIEGADQP